MSARDLCIMACVFCRDPQFHAWMRELASTCYQGGDVSNPEAYNEASAKVFILSLCQIESRNELDTNPDAARDFHKMVREPFIEWKEAQHGD